MREKICTYVEYLLVHAVRHQESCPRKMQYFQSIPWNCTCNKSANYWFENCICLNNESPSGQRGDWWTWIASQAIFHLCQGCSVIGGNNSIVNPWTLFQSWSSESHIYNCFHEDICRFHISNCGSSAIRGDQFFLSHIPCENNVSVNNQARN